MAPCSRPLCFNDHPVSPAMLSWCVFDKVAEFLKNINAFITNFNPFMTEAVII